MPRNPEHEPIYRAFQEFMERCLIEDRSLLWPGEQVWTPERVFELKKRLIDNPLWGTDQSYGEKLLVQLAGVDRQSWQLLADAYYVYYLPSTRIKFDTKQANVAWLAEQAGVPLPAEPARWEAQRTGFASTGQRYNLRYLQTWFLILLAAVVKQAPDRRAVLATHDAFRKTVDEVIAMSPKADKSYDMRLAALYMAFPQENRPVIRDDWRPPDEKAPPPPPPLSEKLSPDVEATLKALKQTRNVILYGPPGTGKTYIARKVADEWTQRNEKATASIETLSAQIVEGLSLYNVLALAMFLTDPKRSYLVSELMEQPLVRARFQKNPVQQPENSVWGYLQRHTSYDSDTVKVASRWEPFLFDRVADSRWHLTDEGRVYVEQNLKDSLEQWRSLRSPHAQTLTRHSWVTFHQNYSYEDFVEGLRPVISEDAGDSISYEIKLGVFRQICLSAADDPSNNYVFVIDEINRGNIAKILGELLTLLEDDKRAGMPNALKVKLPYSQQEFSVPPNLYIIGTMNTTDRSIALLDVALRRRFAFVELMPRPELLTAEVAANGATVSLRALLLALNRAICADLDRDHQLGHSYFLRVQHAGEGERVAALEFVWNHQALPLLREYYHNQPDRLAELLKPLLGEDGGGTGAAEGEDLITGLAQIAGSA